MQHVFIIGSRGLPAQYGGFETFVDQLVSHQVSPAIRYHVACLSDNQAYHHFDYKGVDCFTIKAPKLGPARVIAYDMMAINYALKVIKKQGIQKPIWCLCGAFCTQDSSDGWPILYQSRWTGVEAGQVGQTNPNLSQVF